MLVDVGCSLSLALDFLCSDTHDFSHWRLALFGVRICCYDGTTFYAVLETITRIFPLFTIVPLKGL